MAADLAVQVRVNYVVECNQERHMFRPAGMISIERTFALLTHFEPYFCHRDGYPILTIQSSPNGTVYASQVIFTRLQNTWIQSKR